MGILDSLCVDKWVGRGWGREEGRKYHIPRMGREPGSMNALSACNVDNVDERKHGPVQRLPAGRETSFLTLFLLEREGGMARPRTYPRDLLPGVVHRLPRHAHQPPRHHHLPTDHAHGLHAVAQDVEDDDLAAHALDHVRRSAEILLLGPSHGIQRQPAFHGE